MDIKRKTLFQSETLQIGLFEVRPLSDACGDIERQSLNVMVLRNLLWKRLRNGASDAFEAEAVGLDLLALCLKSLRERSLPVRHSTRAQRSRALERVKEAVVPSSK